jgi:hypothetical protein
VGDHSRRTLAILHPNYHHHSLVLANKRHTHANPYRYFIDANPYCYSINAYSHCYFANANAHYYPRLTHPYSLNNTL